MLSLPFWLIIMAVFLCDATFTLLRRMWRKERWYAAHRSHAYQHLVQKGYSHRTVTLSILLFNVVLLFPMAVLALWKPMLGWFLVVGIFGICAILWHNIESRSV
jgi:Fuc2NAc and GlcNAc transferase